MSNKKQVQPQPLWNGFRPSIIPARKKNKRLERTNNKRQCQRAMKGDIE